MATVRTERNRPRAVVGHARILLFATARTAVGARSLDLPVPPSGTPVRELLAELGREHPSVRPILAHSRFFRDGRPVARLEERVRPGQELAVHPPYGGG
jgi:molybdopterin converting factor small subunit